MIRIFLRAFAFVLLARPALAAKGPFLSLNNTDFVVLLGFIVFIGILVYFKVPNLVLGMLDKRAETIRSELEEARMLREEAQSILASYERKQVNVQAQADAIVLAAREEAQAAAAVAKRDIEASMARRLATAQDQIASAEASAIKEIQQKAIEIAVQAAGDVMTNGMTAQSANKLIDEAIGTIGQKLN